MSFFDEMKSYALSDEQLSQCFEHKIISPNVANLITEPQDDMFSPGILSNDKLKVCGIKLAFNLDDRDFQHSLSSSILFFITDFHMLVFRSPGFQIIRNGKFNSYRSTKPASYFAVPLEAFRCVELISGDQHLYFSEEVTVTVDKGDPVLGSAIGAGLFGAAGAIGGALANSGTKTKVVKPALFHQFQRFGLKFYMDGDQDNKEPIVIDPLFELDNAAGTQDHSFNKSINARLLGKEANSDIPQLCCDELNRLIKKAKQTISNEDRAAVTKPKIEEAELESKASSVTSTIIGGLLLVLLFVFWVNF